MSIPFTSENLLPNNFMSFIDPMVMATAYMNNPGLFYYD